MRTTVARINKRGIKLNKFLLDMKIKGLEIMRGKALEALYDMGALSSKTAFDNKMVLLYLLEEFSTESKLFSTYEGSFDLSYEQVEYVSSKCSTSDVEFLSFAEALRDYTYADYNLALYREAKSSMDSSAKIYPKINVSNIDMVVKSLPVVLEQGFDEVIDYTGYSMYSLNLNKLFYIAMLQEMGFKFEEAKNEVSKGESLFLNGVSFDIEVRLLKKLCSFSLEVDGRFAKTYAKVRELEFAEEMATRNSLAKPKFSMRVHSNFLGYIQDIVTSYYGICNEEGLSDSDTCIYDVSTNVMVILVKEGINSQKLNNFLSGLKFEKLGGTDEMLSSKKDVVAELKKYGVFISEDMVGDEHLALIRRYRSKLVVTKIKPEYADSVHKDECPICFMPLASLGYGSKKCNECGAEYALENGNVKYREATCNLDGGRFTILSNLRLDENSRVALDVLKKRFEEGAFWEKPSRLVLNCVEGFELPNSCHFLGYSGEFISESDLLSIGLDGFKYSAFKFVYVKSEFGVDNEEPKKSVKFYVENYYDVNEIMFDSEKVHPRMGVDLYYKVYDRNKSLAMLQGKFNSFRATGSFRDMLFQFCCVAFSTLGYTKFDLSEYVQPDGKLGVDYDTLVADLACSMLSVEFGDLEWKSKLVEREDINNIKNFLLSETNFKMFYQAAYDAERVRDYILSCIDE